MNTNPIVKPIAIALGILVALFIVGKFLAPKDAPPPADPASASSPAPAAASTPDGPKAKLGSKAVTMANGLKYEDLQVGTGKEAKNGTSIEVHYSGWLTDGTPFDSSKDSGNPYPLTLPGQVIAGWNEGIPGMKAGGKRKLVIPPALGYGEQGQGKIPPGATLVFEVELVKVN
ncbi:FKBP-type peptidyl-prolyl cis-trans isomerase [Armatimonas sp.]|uniref:FKBP-type peptidyl-prolyl cis-trans isomerase n=1 Tax=Armatimonas sp. TaxID=1872638 RepID=UPI00286A444E|nr:FKBP-type peptidyl-prolyl cis-trans isomerase [Armatimonas sp.]